MFQTERLKDLRRARNLTQSEVAEKINVSREAYSMYETGHRQPSCQSLAALSVFFHVSTDYLIGLSDDPSTLSSLNANQIYLLHILPYLDELSSEFLATSIQFRYPTLNPSVIPELLYHPKDKHKYHKARESHPQ